MFVETAQNMHDDARPCLDVSRLRISPRSPYFWRFWSRAVRLTEKLIGYELWVNIWRPGVTRGIRPTWNYPTSYVIARTGGILNFKLR
jgi:hypothetical protein